MLQVAQVAVCSQINTKHINTVWAEHTIVECCRILVMYLVQLVTTKHMSDVYMKLWCNDTDKGNPKDW